MGQVVAAEAFITECEGRQRIVAQGETFDATHAVVKAHPGAFAEPRADNPASAKKRGRPKAKAKRRGRSKKLAAQ